jgi:hypothetical protein
VGCIIFETASLIFKVENNRYPLLNIQAWQTRNDDARAADQQVLNERLLVLETNQEELKETLSRLCK